MPNKKQCLWEIFIPVIKPNSTQIFTAKYHKMWESKVREITHGLTISPLQRGQWVTQSGNLLEQVIPVRITATLNEMEKVLDFTLKFYSQETIICFKLSDEVVIKHSVSYQ